MRDLINKIGLMMLLAAFGFGSVWADSSATFDLCVGDVVNIYEKHSNPYTMKLESNEDETIASGVAPTNRLGAGLFYTVTALKPGSTTIVFKRCNSKDVVQSTETYTVNVSAARQVEVGESVMLTTWGSKASGAKGSSTWTVTPSDPDMVESKKGQDESAASVQVVLTGKASTQGATETVTCSNVSSSAGSEFVFAMEILQPPTMGDDALSLPFGESKDYWLDADYASISPVESDYLTVTPDETTGGKRVRLTSKSKPGSETIRFYDEAGVLLKRVFVNVPDPFALTLCLTESKEFTFTTPDGETAEWKAKSANGTSSGVKLLETATSTVNEFTGTGSNFTFRIVSINANGTTNPDTVTVTRTIDGVTETVASISVQALKDKDKNNSDAYAVISQARKPVTLYMGGEPLNFQNYFSSAKLWRFVDANTDESNFRTTFGYTGTNVFAATTSKEYTYSPDAPGGGSSKNQTKKTHNDFDVAIRAQRVGTGSLTILFGASDQHDPYHFAGYYDVEVRDVPVADGALTGSDLLLTGDKIGTIGVVGTMKGTNGETVTGFFSWENPAEVAYEPGEKTFRATFTPHGDALSAFYDPVAVDVAVTVRLSIPAEPQPVELPPALELTYNGLKQTCRSGLGYMFVLGGVHEATAAGEYEATLTLSQGYYWADGTEGSKRFPWSIVPAKATISAVNARKPLGAVDPDFTATVSGLVDDFEPVYAVVRADHDETFGEHVLLATGETRQGNYTFAYENAVLEIYQVSASCTGDVMETTVGGDTVYTFRSGTCTMTLPDGVRADILVVGGGGSGESARKSVSSDYQGRGGGGGKAVYEMDVDLAADTYTIVVGEGGAASVAYTSSASGTYKTGSPGGESSIAGEGFQLTAAGGEAGAGTKSSVKGESSPGTGGANLSCPISGSPAVYGADGAAGGTMPAGEDAPASAANTGAGGAGGHGGNSGAGGSGIVIVRLQNVIFPRTPVDPPAVATGLVFDNTVQTGVAAGAHYTRGGVHEATVAGEYEAIATPDDGFCWSDTGKHGPRAFGWSIARRPVTISVVSTNKIVGATFVDPDGRTFDDPIFTSTDNGLVASDTDIVSWVIFRTNACEKVGAYDILIDGAAQQGNYDLTFVGGTYRILAASGPTVADGKGTIDYDPGTGVAVVTPNDGVREIEILGLPDGGTAKVPVTVDAVRGVAPDRLRIFAVAPAASGAAVYDITDAFAISGDAGTGVSIVLNDKAAVEIPSGDGAGETIPVSPVLTEPGDPAVEPFVIEGDAVAVGVKTIPGLTYGLKRGAEVSNLRAVGCGDVVDSRQAEGPRTKLVDSMEGDKPAKAFYVIEVKK